MLNDAKLRAAQAREKPYKIFDSHQLYMLVTPAGGKLWRWNYAYGGKLKSLSLGSYPLISLLEARERRDEARKLLKDGVDPAIAKKLSVQARIDASQNTFEKVARDWYETSKPQWAANHAGDVLRSLERDVFPAIGPLPIAELTPPKILEALRTIEQRSAIETAKRV